MRNCKRCRTYVLISQRLFLRTLVRRCFATDGGRLVVPAFGAYVGGLSVRHRAFVEIFGPRAVTAHVLGERRVYAIDASRCLE